MSRKYSDPFYIVTYYIKWDHYFLDRRYNDQKVLTHFIYIVSYYIKLVTILFGYKVIKIQSNYYMSENSFPFQYHTS